MSARVPDVSPALVAGELPRSAQLHAARVRRAWLAIGMAGLALIALSLVSLGTGPVAIPPLRVLSILLSELGVPGLVPDTVSSVQLDTQRAVVLAIRTPRILGAIIIGAALATSGAALQGLFQNPLAGPALVGVSGGAALAAAAVIVLAGVSAMSWLLPPAAFAGSVGAAVLVYSLATRAGRTDVATLLLAGVAVNAIAGAGNGLFVFVANDAQLRDITFWQLGSLGGLSWRSLGLASVPMLVSIVMLPRLARSLNALLLGEGEAAGLGMNVQALKVIAVGLVALSVGASVAVAGIIGFVGLVAPHLVRLSIGPDYRTLLPGAAVTGALLLLLADLVARTIVAPAELPIGIVTALAGGPFFMWLLIRRRKESGYA